MIFILKTYTTTSIEYNVIQLMFSKDMAAQPRQVSNLIHLLSTVYIPSPNLGENTIRSTKPYSNRMMLARLGIYRGLLRFEPLRVPYV